MYYLQALEWSNKAMATNGLESAYPFFDRDLISFLLAIPGGVTCARGVPKAILRTAMRSILPTTIAERRSKAEITRELGVSVDRDFLRFVRYFERDIMCVQLGYVDETRLKRALPVLRSGISGRRGDKIVWQLGDIFGLEFWLQAFWGTKLERNEEDTW
jgi:asparagine synthase (glutamine-hydrolysing)